MDETLRALVRIEADTLDELKDLVANAADDVAAKLGADASRRKIVAALQRSADDLEEGMNTIILQGRDMAAQLAYKTVVIEAESFDFEEPDEPDERDHEGMARAAAIAAAFAAAFMLIALSSSGDTKRDVKRAIGLQEYRLRRIAATEIPNAYSQAALRLYSDLPKRVRVRLMKRWNATLDAKTCPVCLSHHGETVGLGEEFSDGMVPGTTHPHCRCIVELVEA